MSHLENGSVVWVRLGQAWWPGTITTVAKCPPEYIQGLRKMPLAIVKFFHENEFQDVHKSEHIFPYNCERKEEFIRRGQCINRNQSHGEVDLLTKFEADVVTAEKLTGGDMNILQTLGEVAGKRRIDYSDLGFGSPKLKKKKEEGVKRGSDIGQAVVYKMVGSRSVGNKLQRVVIEHKVRILEQPRRENAEEDMRTASKWFKCSRCGFTCTRLNVIIWHNKAHINKVFNYDTGIKIPGRRKRKQGTPKSNKDSKKKAKTAKGKENLDHAHTNGEISGSKKDIQDTQQLLMDWDDDDDDGMDGERSKTLPGGLDKEETNNNSDDGYSDIEDYPPPQPKYERRPMPKASDVNSAFDALLAATPANPVTPSSSQTSNYINNDSDSDYSDWEKYYARDSGSGSEDEEVEQESDIKSLCEGKEGKAEGGEDANSQAKQEEKDNVAVCVRAEPVGETDHEEHMENTPSPKIDNVEDGKSRFHSYNYQQEELTPEPEEDEIKQSTLNTHYEPTENIGEPTENIGEPTENTGEPTENIGEPTENIGEPTENTSESTNYTSEAVEENGEPSEITNESTDVNELSHYTDRSPEDVDKSYDEVEKPPEVSHESTEVSQEPSEGIFESSENIFEPSKDIFESTQNTDKLVEDTDKPAEDTDKTEDADEKAKGTDKPAKDIYEPAEDIYEPADEIYEPAEDSYEPADETDKSEDTYEPAEVTYEPAEADKPPEEVYKPVECLEPIEDSSDDKEDAFSGTAAEDSVAPHDHSNPLDEYSEEPDDRTCELSICQPVEETNESSNDIEQLTQNIDKLNKNIEEFTQNLNVTLAESAAVVDNAHEMRVKESRYESVESISDSVSYAPEPPHSKTDTELEDAVDPGKTSDVPTPSSSGTTYMLVAVDAHGNTVPTVPTPALSEGGNDLVAVEATMEDGTTRTLYIDPSQLGPNVDLNNLMLHIDSSGQEHVIIPSSSSSDSETPSQELPSTNTHDLQSISETSNTEVPYPAETHGYDQMNYVEPTRADHYSPARPEEGESS